ncbi:hypothetical protein G6F50_018156 [Rhizopus delemar]|uniref:Uncharacterized protein n=1 Tax=Rhizopus delemar TaxID=936053 RepID=A0A9P6XNL9_9FUNG|nr:hypothetical protein G6F23_015740 [Rhizopus arrhizus]KAG1529204.1 hypothetical protein G6F50_018156 [Rhizopus delemar]
MRGWSASRSSANQGSHPPESGPVSRPGAGAVPSAARTPSIPARHPARRRRSRPARPGARARHRPAPAAPRRLR